MDEGYTLVCDSCDGSGEYVQHHGRDLPTELLPCKDCHGTGIVPLKTRAIIALLRYNHYTVIEPRGRELMGEED
jgi:DnaJ-class molecular chaperone